MFRLFRDKQWFQSVYFLFAQLEALLPGMWY